jgi:alpha-1,6-mannosyltransferase
MRLTPARLAIGGAVYLSAMTALMITEARLGSALFFSLVAVASVVYLAVLVGIWRGAPLGRVAFGFALACAVAFRIVLAMPPVNPDNDLIRYLWDARVQRLGYNPYAVRPADPALAATHSDETRDMPSARARTPYPPGAQLFFRGVVTIHDSSRAMKVALVGCDLLTILVVWRWLLVSGRSEWLTLAYAWNPLVILESAHSGHLDTLGALWIALCAYALTRKRTALAAVIFVLAVTTKLLPIVLAPLFWQRIRIRDLAAGGLVLALLYAPFTVGANPFTEVTNVVEHIRFNAPVFGAIAYAATPQAAAGAAVGAGLLAAVWCRRMLPRDHPGAWAWPMAIALIGAPVIYPWYLLYLTPFLLVPATLPLIVWTLTVSSAYVVWEIAQAGGRWIVPAPVLVFQYGAVAATFGGMAWWIRRGRHNSSSNR